MRETFKNMEQAKITLIEFKNIFNDYLENNNFNSQTQGAKLEKLIYVLIKAHSLGQELHDIDTFQSFVSKRNFKNLTNQSTKDEGIDLIGYSQRDEIIPIQAKNYLNNNKISRNQISDFHSAIIANKNSYKLKIKSAWIVYKGVFSKEAEDYLEKINFFKGEDGFEIKKIAVNDLLDKIFYFYHLDKFKQIVFEKWLEEIIPQDYKSIKLLRPYQNEAVQKAQDYYHDHNRGHMVMACGTGKTLTSLAIAEKITPKNGNNFIFSPNIRFNAPEHWSCSQRYWF